MKTGTIQEKIDSLMNQLQDKTGVSEEEISELKKILDLSDFSDQK